MKSFLVATVIVIAVILLIRGSDVYSRATVGIAQFWSRAVSALIKGGE